MTLQNGSRSRNFEREGGGGGGGNGNVKKEGGGGPTTICIGEKAKSSPKGEVHLAPPPRPGSAPVV